MDLARQGFCRCGCGQIAKAGNQYVQGHNRKGTARLETVTCAVCGSTKQLYPYEAKRFKYCSNKCRGEGMRLKNKERAACLKQTKTKGQ